MNFGLAAFFGQHRRFFSIIVFNTHLDGIKQLALMVVFHLDPTDNECTCCQVSLDLGLVWFNWLDPSVSDRIVLGPFWVKFSSLHRPLTHSHTTAHTPLSAFNQK